MLKRTIPALFLTVAASGFAASVGGFTEATTPTAVLLASGMLGDGSTSYILSPLQAQVRGSASSLGSSLLPSMLRTANNATTDTADTTSGTVSNDPIFIMDPNLGFTVILNADFGFQAADQPITDPGGILLVTPATGSPAVGNNPVITVTDTASNGVTDTFTGAPSNPGAVADAGAGFTDNNAPPTVIIGGGNTIEVGPGTADPSIPTDPSTPPANDPNASAPGAAPVDPGVIDTSAEAIPEPATVVGVGMALLGLGFLKSRRPRN